MRIRSIREPSRWFFTGALVFTTVLPAAQPSHELPAELKGVEIRQRLGDALPLDTPFRDSAGREVRLGTYFGERPVILAPVYYDCPMLCSMILTGLTRSLQAVSLEPGDDYEIVAFSFNPAESSADAAEAKRRYARQLRREGAERGWHFLTGSRVPIDQLTKSIGFDYRFDSERGEFNHASAILIATPEGEISRYFYGIEYPSRDVQFGLIEASKNKIGTLVDQVLLYCFHYDPETGKYGLVIMNVLRLLGGVTVLVLALFIAISLRRERRPKFETIEGRA